MDSNESWEVIVGQTIATLDDCITSPDPLSAFFRLEVWKEIASLVINPALDSSSGWKPIGNAGAASGCTG